MNTAHNLETMEKKALIYLRVSTDRQAEKGFSLPAQDEACRIYAKAHGYIVEHVYRDEGESARSDDRPQLQEMLNRCDEGDIAAVIVYKLDRFARNTFDHMQNVARIRSAKAQLLSVTENLTETPEGLLVEGILAGVAQFFSGNLARDVLKGMNERAKQGMCNSKAPPGYKNMREIINENSERRFVIPDSATKDYVIQAFEKFATGSYTVADICDWFFSVGMTQKKNKEKPMAVSMVSRMFSNKFYIGITRWNGIVGEGVHEPIISKELFQRVQIVLDDRVHGRSRKRKNLFLLRGLMTCGECGGIITYENQTTSSKRLIPYYRCSKRKNSRKVACTQPYIQAEVLEKEMFRAVEAARLPRHIVIKLEKKLKEIHEREQESVTRERKQLQAKIDQLNEKERSLVNKYLENKLTEEIYETIREEVSSERINCKARLEASESTIQVAIKVLERAVTFARDIPVAYKRAPDPIKRQFLSTLFKEIVAKDGGLQKVVLNEPLDFICRDLPGIKNSPVIFDGEAFGDPTGNRTRICTVRGCRPNR